MEAVSGSLRWERFIYHSRAWLPREESRIRIPVRLLVHQIPLDSSRGSHVRE
jgi:hypothetical protein